MISYEPLPFFEANLFLANHAMGVSWTSFLERTFGKGSATLHSEPFCTYSQLLIELEHRLLASVTVPNDTIQMLYGPLYHKGRDTHHPSGGYAGGILLPNAVEAYVDWNASEFFSHVRSSANQVPQRILEMLETDCNEVTRNVDIPQLFSLINHSDLPQNSKLILTDLALNTSRYVDLFEDALSPVALEFTRCRDLIEPLLQQFRQRYSHEDEESILARLWPGDRNHIREIYLYPSIVCSNYTIFASNGDDTRMLGYLGSLHEFLTEYYAYCHSSGIQLTKTLAALGNQNRFNILTKLLEGPAYGRELASFVGLSPVTVSQHIGILMSSNLVSVHNDGVKNYYSLNTEEMERFLSSFRTYFRLESPPVSK